MANVKISQLPVASTVSTSDIIPIVQGGVTKQATVAAQMNNSGLVYIAGTSFTDAASLSVNNCFTSTYDNYKLMINISATSLAGPISLRYRVGGVDANGSVYYYAGLLSFTNTALTPIPTSGGAQQQTFMSVQDPTHFPGHPITMEIMQPYLALRTFWTSQGMYSVNPVPYAIWMNGVLNNTTSYDGFSIYNDAGGTISGTYGVYGYRKS